MLIELDAACEKGFNSEDVAVPSSTLKTVSTAGPDAEATKTNVDKTTNQDLVAEQKVAEKEKDRLEPTPSKTESPCLPKEPFSCTVTWVNNMDDFFLTPTDKSKDFEDILLNTQDPSSAEVDLMLDAMCLCE